MIILKTPEEISVMREGGKRLARVLQKVEKAIRPGVSTGELDLLAEQEILREGGKPSFKGYQMASAPSYPASLCVSVNDEVVHGIPKASRVLKEGDIVGLDIGMWYGGLCTDMAVTVPVGKTGHIAERLIATARDALSAAVDAAGAGSSIGDISAAIQHTVEDAHFSVIRDLVGHGVGKNLHEEPQIPCYGRQGTGPVITEGMTLAIEPMIVEKDWKITVDDDGWTIRTADGGLAAHFEHTVAITADGVRILTEA
jgi:methionyl aminopeptidase